MMKPEEMIAVISAHMDGKPVQFAWVGRDNWADLKHPPIWDFSSNDYRVKPEPREFWIHKPTTGGYIVERSADSGCAGSCEVIHVREVIA